MNLLQSIARAISLAGLGARVGGPEGDGDMIGNGENIVNAAKDLNPIEIERRHQDADRAGFSGLNSPNEKIGAISQAIGGFEHAANGVVGADSMAGQNERDRGLGDTRLGRDSFLTDKRPGGFHGIST